MSEESDRGTRSQVSAIIPLPRAALYRACLDPDAVATWRVPDDMSAQVAAFDAREGGTFRISLTYDDPARATSGKTTGGTDTFRGHFVRLVPDRQIVEAIEFESADPVFAGEMTMTTTFDDVDGGTRVTIRCDGLPPGVHAADNDEGTAQALRKLAEFVRSGT